MKVKEIKAKNLKTKKFIDEQVSDIRMAVGRGSPSARFRRRGLLGRDGPGAPALAKDSRPISSTTASCGKTNRRRWQPSSKRWAYPSRSSTPGNSFSMP